MRRGLLILLALLPAIVLGGSSANYLLEPSAVDGGGLLAGSQNYTVSFSSSAGGAGASANYASRTGYAGQLAEALPSVIFTPPASLAFDGTGKNFTATGGGISYSLRYEGRGFTSDGVTSVAPSAVGLYLATAMAGPDYLGTAQQDFVISGPIAMTDSLTKPANHARMSILVSELLANDSRLLADGTITSGGLTVTGISAGAGNRVFLGSGGDAGWILFIPSTAPSDSFSYLLSDGTSTVTGAVTVSALGFTPAFTLQMNKRGTAVFDGTNTTSTFDFVAVPGQFYQIEYSSDLTQWIPAGSVASGATGSFSVNLSRAGDFAAVWNNSLFFRAKR